MIEIDGSFGEGGGQILRTSLSLACLTGQRLCIFNIRAGRKKPGLAPQHLLSASAAAAITGGALTGALGGSTELLFSPGPIRPGEYFFDVAATTGSAGATGLVFQTLVYPLAFASAASTVVIKGGTHVEWAPPADYIRDVFLHALKPLGMEVEFLNPVSGYYPIGQGEVRAVIRPSKGFRAINIIERGRLKKLFVRSAVSNLPSAIAERQLKRTLERLGGYGAEGECVFPPSPGRGTFVFILAEFENIRAGFSALGAIGKKAEAVADEAAEKFLRFIKTDGALDPHLADQIVLSMALAKGASRITTSEVTNHLRTNIHVIERFLPVRFSLTGEAGSPGRVEVEGAGFSPGAGTSNIA